MPSLNELYPYYEDYIEDIHKRFEKLNKDIALKHNRHRIVPLISKRLTPYAANELFKIKDCLDQIFPERYDIQVVFEPKFKYANSDYGLACHIYSEFDKVAVKGLDIIIHYPELTITNSKDQSINIKDLFIKIPIGVLPKNENDTYSIKKIRGTRTTLSRDEYNAKYFHSHLPRFNNLVRDNKDGVGEFADFCTGSDTDINVNLSLLNTESSLDVNMFKLYLMQIDTMVKWESLEGVPHIGMKDVIGKNYDLDNYNLNTLENNYNQIDTYLNRGKNTDIELDFTFNNGKYCIVDNEKFEDWLIGFKEIMYIQYLKDDQGKYYTKFYTTETDVKASHLTKFIIFNGEKKLFTVEQQNTVGEINQKLYVHPQIKNYVKSRLEFITNKEIARENTISRLSQGSYR